MIDDVLAIPDHVSDALWRVDSARLEAAPAAGLAVCGLGGSAIGADLATALLGDRLNAPLATVRGYSLPSWVSGEWAVLCCSYSGGTEETLACFEAAGERGARRLVVSTGGALVDGARASGVPVVGLPGILQPRAAVAYMVVAVAEVAALTGIAPGLRAEIEAAATFLSEQVDELRARAARLAAEIGTATPVFFGADLTAPIARRWQTQANENAKLLAFRSELPEADHNEIEGWAGSDAASGFAAVLLGDRDQHPRLRRRFELTGEALRSEACAVIEVEAEGESRAARLLWTTMLGDLVSLELAAARGVDPEPITAIEGFKRAMGPAPS